MAIGLGATPTECERYSFPARHFMFPSQAKKVITLLNSQRRMGTRNTKPTTKAVNALLHFLHVGTRNTPTKRRVRVKFFSNPFLRMNPKNGHDRIDTASTNGQFLKVYNGIITDKEFEEEPGHLGIPRPRLVSHYAVVILHEVGHVIHKRFQRLGRREVTRVMGSLFYPDCFIDPRQFESRSDWAEWFADMFSLSIVLLAKKAT